MNVSDDGEKLSFIGDTGNSDSHERCSFIRTSTPVPPHLQEFGFETEILELGEDETSAIGVGFTKHMPENNYNYDDMTGQTNAIAFCLN